MTYQVRITQKAKLDMVRAADHIEFTLLNPTMADALLDKAAAEISSLSTFPERRPVVDDPVLSSWGIRFIMINNYLAFYIISEQEKAVYVIRFLYGKRNWASILKQGYVLD